ncbi:hypothetical protein [Kitasatospora sp. NPDC057936]|uniref:hypothetical protein n=1 Tax=Kitasatospora sp. NPDC057936 TaxID=3346283 RepID=UPI0036D7C767
MHHPLTPGDLHTVETVWTDTSAPNRSRTYWWTIRTFAPGDTALGYITFQIPSSSKIQKVQFALDSGFAPTVGQWDVP